MNKPKSPVAKEPNGPYGKAVTIMASMKNVESASN